MAWSKDIFFSFSLSGAASLLFVFLCALSDLRGEQKNGSGLTASTQRNYNV
jgi:hypothetical protein